MADFNTLSDAGASQGTDQVAVVRGASTLRQTIARILAGIADNSIAAVKSRAGTAAHAREWRNRLGIADDWSEIANGTAIGLGKVVEHGGAYFGCITAHSKSSTGPDGDAANWTLLSAFYGNWSNAWFPAGAFVLRAGSPYLATQAIVRGDPAPDASNNSKWLRLGAPQPSVVIASSNTAIPSSARGNTYVHTGSSNITYTLPAASGGSAVDNGWEIVISNQGAGDLTIDGAGADTIDGEATLVITDNGRSVRLQKLSNGVWATIADTKDETGTSSSFSPSKANLYDAVKAIFVHNTAVTADDANNELDFATGAAAALLDNSIAAAKARADAAGDKKAWRLRIGAWHLSVTADSTLPAVTNFNAPDGVLLGQSGDTSVSFADISDRSTPLTAGIAGDFMLIFGRGWVRVGNLFTGGSAAVAARALAEANAARVNRMTVFETAVVNPPGIPGNDFPEFLGLSLLEKIDPRRIVGIRVKIGGQQAAASVDSATLAPFNDLGSGELTQRGRGGILNLTLNATARANLKNAVSTNVQFVEGEIEYKFEGTSLQSDVLPDVIDHFHFATNNNGYPAISGLSQAQVDARVLALRSLVATSATPVAGDRFFFTDENQAGDPLRYTDVYTLSAALARRFTARAATAGASRTWTYTLAAADTEIMFGAEFDPTGGTTNVGSHSVIWPRSYFSQTRWIIIEGRNPGDSQTPDNKTLGCQVTLAGNTLTCVTTGFVSAWTSAPLIWSK